MDNPDMADSQWAFLADDFDFWLGHVGRCDNNYDSGKRNELVIFCEFEVNLPSDASHDVIRRLRSTTELVCLMLRVDPTAWRFVKKLPGLFPRPIYISRVGLSTLVPKIAFCFDTAQVLSQLEIILGDDHETEAVREAKAKIYGHCDPHRKLNSFKIPVELRSIPLAPKILRAVARLIEAFQAKCNDSSRTYQFALKAISLIVHPQRSVPLSMELRELSSYRIPIRVKVPHGTGAPDITNEYTTFAENPSLIERPHSRGLTSYDLDLYSVRTSSEFWSALAFIPNVQAIRLCYPDNTDRMTQAKWLSYALRQGGVANLSIYWFEPTLEELDWIRTMACTATPAHLLKQATNSLETSSVVPQVVTLKKDAQVRTAAGDTKSLEELCVPVDWRFPVVDFDERLGTIEFVVPGYALCSTACASVLSIDEIAQARVIKDVTTDGLETLVITSPRANRAPIGGAATFVEIFGRSLRTLRWEGDRKSSFEDDVPFDEDLTRFLCACPALESVAVANTRMLSLQALQDHCNSHPCHLRELKLDNVSIPPPELVKFFAHLSDPGNRLARTLTHLEYGSKCYGDNEEGGDTSHGDEEAVIDAVIAMLNANRTLSSITILMRSDGRKAIMYTRRFWGDVVVKTGRLPLREKLAFLSVVQSHEMPLVCALGRLDSSCIAQIFEFFTGTRTRPRRVIFRHPNYYNR